MRSRNHGNRRIPAPIPTNKANVIHENKMMIRTLYFKCGVTMDLDFDALDGANLEG